MSEKVSIGILAVQGAFAEHQAMLDGLGADTFLIRQKKDLEEAVQMADCRGSCFPEVKARYRENCLETLACLTS